MRQLTIAPLFVLAMLCGCATNLNTVDAQARSLNALTASVDGAMLVYAQIYANGDIDTITALKVENLYGEYLEVANAWKRVIKATPRDQVVVFDASRAFEILTEINNLLIIFYSEA